MKAVMLFGTHLILYIQYRLKVDVKQAFIVSHTEQFCLHE